MGESRRGAALLAGLALGGIVALAGAPAGATTEAPARLGSVLARIDTAHPWARLAGPAITEYYVDERRDVVRVGVERVTPALRTAARRTFGSAVELHQGERYYRASRGDDPAPHTAGAAIDTELGRCTSGFGVSRGGRTYFLGTAHCYTSTGETATNHGRAYGRVAARRLTERGPDAALVASDFAPRMYVGGPDSDTARPVRGARTPRYGARLCTSGASTGETCSAVRRQANICVRFGDGMTTCHLTRAVSTDGTPLVQSGDSGGPVYVGGVYAVGMTVGGNRDGTELLYHPVGYLLDLWDARLLADG